MHQSHEGSSQGSLRFSVVIPTYDRKDVVLASVQALAAQTGTDAYEVIVVVDGSTDGSASALRKLDVPFPLTVVEQENRGQADARNRGAELARGELLLFLDDDMEAQPDLLIEHEHSHSEGADVVIGHIPLHPESPPSFLAAAVGVWADRRARAIVDRGGSLDLDDLLTGQISLRSEVFERIGGFEPSFTSHGAFGGEDLDFGRRLLDAGYSVVFNPKAVSRQRYVVTPRQYLEQWRRVGRSDVLLARKHPDQIKQIFRRKETVLDVVLGRGLLPLLPAIVVALARAAPRRPRVRGWFFRVRDLEYLRGVRAAGGPPAPRPLRILCYHAVSDLAGVPVVEPYGVPPWQLERQLDVLNRYFHVIGADELARYLDGRGVPRRAVLVTFDDCYEDLLDRAVPALRRRGLPALAFAVTGRLGATNDWDAHLGAPSMKLLDQDGLAALMRSDVAVASHSRSHRSLTELSPEELDDELDASRADLSAIGIDSPPFLAYPYGQHDAQVRRAAAARGFQAAFTVEPGLVRPGQNRYALPRIEILREDAGWRFLWKVLKAGR